MTSSLSTSPLLIIIFTLVVLGMFLLDLGIMNKKAKAISNKEAAIWTSIWISLSMLFSGFIWWQSGFEKFTQFQSAYWIEQALSVDNLFVFILIFSYFKIEGILQHKILLWGIIGAVIFRAIFIFAGVELINLSYLPEFDFIGCHFSSDHNTPINYVTKTFLKPNLILTFFGIFLIFAGVKSLKKSNSDASENYDNNRLSKLLS